MTIIYRILAYCAITALCCVVTAIKVADHIHEQQLKQEMAYAQKTSGIAASVQQRLDAANTKVQIQYKTVVEKIPYAVTQYVEVPGTAPQERSYMLTAGERWLYDDAYGDAFAGPAPCADGSLACPQSLTLTSTSLSDLYETHASNAAVCLTYYNVAVGWQQWWAQVSKVKP